MAMAGLEHLTKEERKAVADIKRRVLMLVGDRLKGFSIFGSKARGDYDDESDLDLAILVDELSQKEKREIIDAIVDFEVRYLVVVSPLILSTASFDGLKTRERRIAMDIEVEGIPL
jgi:hypothetical protein